MDLNLIYANADSEDIGVMKDYSFDLAYGDDENDFECAVVESNHCCKEGYLLYIEGTENGEVKGTEYGGIIDDIGIDTAQKKVTYFGRTWHGILNKKVIYPDSGVDYLMLSGDANEIIAFLIDRMGLNSLFLASSNVSEIIIDNYRMPRYIAGYDGLRKMLKDHGAKLNIEYIEGFVVLSAKPIVDYSSDEQFDKSQIALKIKKKYHPVNHVICLGKGELAEREVIHIYADKSGNISETQVFTGLDEVVEIYENVNAVDSEELRQSGIDKIKASWTSDELDFNFNPKNKHYDIGDIVGAKENITNVEVATEITKKIVKIKKGTISISYPCGNSIIVEDDGTTSILGKAVLGKMILGVN